VQIWEAVEQGRAIPDADVKFEDVNENSLYTICYTSGTTGNQKGVMLVHKNFVSCVAAFLNHDPDCKFMKGDRYVSYLPLSHIFERYLFHLCLYTQIQYGFF